ncbi:hypothetical protein K9N68_19540 [Kovacikia minuta CCNUW1]|nr:hypothetical protein [Kovacikia minuta]UBF23938.1 hypothetical protein K9N68_19540 [Kovacikia minuta CCNUW1]
MHSEAAWAMASDPPSTPTLERVSWFVPGIASDPDSEALPPIQKRRNW